MIQYDTYTKATLVDTCIHKVYNSTFSVCCTQIKCVRVKQLTLSVLKCSNNCVDYLSISLTHSCISFTLIWAISLGAQ